MNDVLYLVCLCGIVQDEKVFLRTKKKKNPRPKMYIYWYIYEIYIYMNAPEQELYYIYIYMNAPEQEHRFETTTGNAWCRI